MKHPAINFHSGSKENFFRIMLFYNNRAVRYIQAKTNLNKNIHEARLCFKRIRSLLRLVRPGLKKDTYNTLNAFYRNQGRKLSQARDMTALIEAVNPMIQSRRSTSTKTLLVRMQKQWMQTRRHICESGKLMQAKTSVCHDLEAIKQCLEAGHIPDISIQYDLAGQATHQIHCGCPYNKVKVADQMPIADKTVFMEGLIRVYRQGKQRYHACIKNPGDHDLHEWRKYVKYTWYQLVMLQPLWPGLIKAWCKEWQVLSVWLGDYHDLVLLTAAAKSFGSSKDMAPGVKNLMQSIGRYKQQLLHQSRQQGRRLYAESAAEVRNRLAACLPEAPH